MSAGVVVESVKNGARVWLEWDDAPAMLLFTMRRYSGDAGRWCVQEPWSYFHAVVDDFGSLVRVPS